VLQWTYNLQITLFVKGFCIHRTQNEGRCNASLEIFWRRDTIFEKRWHLKGENNILFMFILQRMLGTPGLS